MTTQKQQALERKARIATLRAEIAKAEADLGAKKAEGRGLTGVAKAQFALVIDAEQTAIDQQKLEVAELNAAPTDATPVE